METAFNDVIEVGGHKVGRGQRCFVVAEIGINHNGDLTMAKAAIDAAVEAGADALKFQSYKAEEIVVDRSLTYEYLSRGQRVVESQYDMFKRCELPRGAFRDLKERCERRGVLFVCTPSSTEGVDELVKIGTPFLKSASDSLGNLPLVRAMARSGVPAVLSTGMSTLEDIGSAVTAFREAGGRDLVVLHCTSSYPTPPADVHLRKIPALAAVLGCPIGLSDHTQGTVAAVGAVVLGACFLEKHFTLDKELPGPDHWFSADPAELRALVQAVRTVEANLGSSVIGPAESEAGARSAYRLSCVSARPIRPGARLTAADVIFRRPGTGLPPAVLDLIVGRIAAVDIPAGHVFLMSDFA
jgi:N-acetylneuraminate synthase/N,N'-diacetyllegionaminate synthase